MPKPPAYCLDQGQEGRRGQNVGLAGDVLLDRQGRAAGPERPILLSDGNTEGGNDAVSRHLFGAAAMVQHGAVHLAMDDLHQRIGGFLARARGERGETDHV